MRGLRLRGACKKFWELDERADDENVHLHGTVTLENG